jgi:hypothetical protein
MKNWFSNFDQFSENLLEGLKNAPLKVKENKRLIFKFSIFIIGLLFCLYLLILLFITLIANAVYFVLKNKEVIIISFIVICMIFSSISSKRDKAKQEQLRNNLEEQNRQEKQAMARYTYLRMFLFKILDDRLCNLTEIVKPVTPNLLNALTPITVDDSRSIIYYNFQVHKIKTLPFSQGTDYVQNLLSSHVMAKMQIEGIEGITAPINDNLLYPLYVDEIKDLGSMAIIVLVMDCEAYRALKESQGALQSRKLIEHI